MKVERIIKLEKSFAESVRNIYMNAARFHWSSSEINEHYRDHILKDETYRKMPRYAHSFVEGVRHHCDHLHWKLVVFTYVIKGKRLAIDSKAYRKVSPQYVHETCSQSGAFAYRENLDKLFTPEGGGMRNGALSRA